MVQFFFKRPVGCDNIATRLSQPCDNLIDKINGWHMYLFSYVSLPDDKLVSEIQYWLDRECQQLLEANLSVAEQWHLQK